MSRWLVVGCDGMLGRDLVAALGEPPGAHEVTAVDRDVLDITDPDACLAYVAGHDIVVNVAAWTAVDEAETHEAQAFAINAVGAANLARRRHWEGSTSAAVESTLAMSDTMRALVSSISSLARHRLSSEQLRTLEDSLYTSFWEPYVRSG